jgi:hypothetical protein
MGAGREIYTARGVCQKFRGDTPSNFDNDLVYASRNKNSYRMPSKNVTENCLIVSSARS